MKNIFQKKNNLSPHERANAINKEAKELGVHPSCLTTETGSVETDHYEIHLRNQSEKAFKMLNTAQKYTIVSSIAAIMTAIIAIFKNCN